MNGAYAERILDAPDVCKNCLRVIRIERVDPAQSSGITREYEAHLERNPKTTEIAYGPADSVGEQKGVFCEECGTEGAHDRIWHEDDVGAVRFNELVQQAIVTLERKGVTLSREDFAAHALNHRHRQDEGVDVALSKATEAAIVAAAASNTDEPERERA